LTQQERRHQGSAKKEQVTAVVAEFKQLEEHEQNHAWTLQERLAATEARNVALQNELDKQLRKSNEATQSWLKAKACVDQMRPLAVAGANVLAFKGQGAQKIWCSYEEVGHGRCGSVRRGMMMDPSGTGKILQVVFKVVDVTWATDLGKGWFSGLGPGMEPCLTTIAAAAIAKAKAVTIGAAAAVPGALGGGDLLGLVNGLHLMLLPPIHSMSEEALLEFLDQNFARPPFGFRSEQEELSWVQQRDSEAERWMKEKEDRGEQTLVIVMPLAEGGSLLQHVAKPGRGFHCSAGGVLTLDNALFLFNFLATQLMCLRELGMLVRDIKTANVLVAMGLPLLADFDSGVCGPIISWLLKHGLAPPDSKISMHCGTRGYVAKHVAGSKRQALTAAELEVADGQWVKKLARGDVFGLGMIFLDILTGVLRRSLVTWPLLSSQVPTVLQAARQPEVEQRVPANPLILTGGEYENCTLVPERVSVMVDPHTPLLVGSQQLPEGLRAALMRGIKSRASAAERLEGLLNAVGKEVDQRAARLGLSSLEFMQLQQQQVQAYDWAGSSS
jgi:hypothetical protein